MAKIDLLKTKWVLAFRDRGLGHGDYAIMTPNQDLVVECPSKEVANHIVELHNAVLKEEAKK